MAGDAVEIHLSADRAETTEMLRQERGALTDAHAVRGLHVRYRLDRSYAAQATPVRAPASHRRNRTNSSHSNHHMADRRTATAPPNGGPVIRKVRHATTGRGMNQRTEAGGAKSRSRRLLSSIGMAALSICSVTTGASANGACEHEMARAARTHGVPLGVLYAVGLSETGRKGVLNPYALNIDGKTVSPRTSAMPWPSSARRRTRAPSWSISAACRSTIAITATSSPSVRGDVRSGQERRLCGALSQGVARAEGSWTMAVARYNAGPNNTIAQKRYVCSVIGSLVASGFGSWTSKARAHTAVSAHRQ